MGFKFRVSGFRLGAAASAFTRNLKPETGNFLQCNVQPVQMQPNDEEFDAKGYIADSAAATKHKAIFDRLKAGALQLEAA